MKLSKTLAMMKRLRWLLLCGVLGFVGASLYQSLHGPSVEANTTLGATAADSGSHAPIIDGVDWVSDHGTTHSPACGFIGDLHCAVGSNNRLTGQCVIPLLRGLPCIGVFSTQCPRGANAKQPVYTKCTGGGGFICSIVHVDIGRPRCFLSAPAY